MKTDPHFMKAAFYALLLSYSCHSYAADISWTAVPGTTERDSIVFYCNPQHSGFPQEIRDRNTMEIHPGPNQNGVCLSAIDVDYRSWWPSQVDALLSNPTINTLGAGTGTCRDVPHEGHVHCDVEVQLYSKFIISMDMKVGPWVREMNDADIYIVNGDEKDFHYKLGFDVKPDSRIEMLPQSPIPTAFINRGQTPARIQIINKGPSGNDSIKLKILTRPGLKMVGGTCLAVLDPYNYVICRVRDPSRMGPGETRTFNVWLSATSQTPVGVLDLPTSIESELGSYGGIYTVQTRYPY